MESMTNRRRIVYNPNSFARLIRAGLVVIIPSALVYFWIKSTAISLELSPAIRSIWTIAIFPEDFTVSTMSGILQMSPYKIKMTRLSLVRHFFNPSSSLIAAIIGESSIASLNSFFIGNYSISFILFDRKEVYKFSLRYNLAHIVR